MLSLIGVAVFLSVLFPTIFGFHAVPATAGHETMAALS
jgi:hypothetical protein